MAAMKKPKKAAAVAYRNTQPTSPKGRIFAAYMEAGGGPEGEKAAYDLAPKLKPKVTQFRVRSWVRDGGAGFQGVCNRAVIAQRARRTAAKAEAEAKPKKAPPRKTKSKKAVKAPKKKSAPAQVGA